MKREIDQCLSDFITSLPFASQVLEGSDVVAGVDFFQVARFEKLDCVVDFLGVHPAVRVVEAKNVYNGNTWSKHALTSFNERKRIRFDLDDGKSKRILRTTDRSWGLEKIEWMNSQKKSNDVLMRVVDIAWKRASLLGEKCELKGHFEAT